MTASPPKPVQVRLLGGLDVRCDDEPVAFPTKQAALLFAYLAARNGVPETRWRLAGLFWADRGEEQARGSLRQTLYRIRRELPQTDPPVLVADARTVSVNANLVSVDFLDLSEDGSTPDTMQYKEFLAGWEGISPEFDEWLQATRAEARFAFSSRLARVAEKAEKRRDFEEYVSVARALAESDPYDEHAARQLMTGLAFLGNTHAAVAVYRGLRNRFANDLQTEPSPETRNLVLQIETRTGPFESPDQDVPGKVGPLREEFDRQDITERRLVTVLAIRVAQPAAGQNSSPDAVVELVESLREPFDATVRKFGGRMDRAPGLTCLCWFGWPVGSEHAAQNAAHAALSLQRFAGCRIGIATGEVLIVPGRGPIGLPPDIAMDLVMSAGRGNIALCGDTVELLGPGFNLAPMEGYSDAKLLTGAAIRSGRFGARHADSIPTLLGRRRERDLLADKLTLADEGEGQLVVVTGEPGIGKSHLQEELAHLASSYDARRILLQCSPQNSHSAYKPLLDHIRGRVRLGDTDAATAGRRLRLHLKEAGVTDPQHIEALSRLLNVAAPSGDDRDKPGPEVSAGRAALIKAAAAYVANGSDSRLTFVVLEDAHWADPSTMELVNALAAEILYRRLFILITARTGFDFGELPDLNRSALTLSGLSRADLRKLVRQSVAPYELPEATVADIATRADGVPLFAEELALSAAGGNRKPKENAKSTPQSLRLALEARLDDLGPFKDVARHAACIGRVFDRLALLYACSGVAADVDAALNEMLNRRLAFRHPSAENDTFAFRHALICETAYESLPEKEKIAIHGRLLTFFSRQGATEPEILGRHAALANRHEDAVRIYKESGERSLAGYAHQEAKRQFQLALDQLAFVPFTEQAEDDRLEITHRLCLCTALSLGYGHPETIARLEECHRLALSRPSSRFTIPILWQTYSLHYTHADGDRVYAVGEQVLLLGLWNAEYGSQEAVGKRFMAAGEMIRGRFRSADQLFAEATAALFAPDTGNSVGAIGVDQAVPVGMLHARVMAILGREAEAREKIHSILKLADEGQLVHSKIVANVLAGHVMLILGDYTAAGKLAESTLFVANREGTSMWRGYSECILGVVEIREGDTARGIERYEQGREVLRLSRTRITTTYLDAVYADALADSGETAKASDVFEAVSDAIAEGAEPWCHAEAMRLDAINAKGTGRHTAKAARRMLNQATDLARGQEAGLWLARLHRSVGA